jgi:hypothetical protein
MTEDCKQAFEALIMGLQPLERLTRLGMRSMTPDFQTNGWGYCEQGQLYANHDMDAYYKFYRAGRASIPAPGVTEEDVNRVDRAITAHMNKYGPFSSKALAHSALQAALGRGK